MRGFTLLELMVGITIGVVVVVTGHALVTSVADGGHRLRSHYRELAAQRNAARWLETAFGSLAVGDEEDAVFVGGDRRMEFVSSLPTPLGWSERTSVAIHWEEGSVRASTARGGFALYQEVQAFQAAYLGRQGEDAPWGRTWRSPVSAPAAIRLIITRGSDSGSMSDTLVFLLRERA